MTVWLLAFAVHSSLWLGLAWLWIRLRPVSDARLREGIWYTAIAASLVTPTVQALDAWSTVAGWRLMLPESWRVLGRGEHASASAWDWSGLALSSWIAIGGCLLLSYVGRLVWLRRQLGPRAVVEDHAVREQLGRLSRRAGLRRAPRLTVAETLRSPISLGVGRGAEICVPSRALLELRPAELRALLGHETAHHRRRDSLRLGVLNVLQAAFFFQPLMRLAVRGIRASAEEQCDDWAADQLDDPLAMASCLTEVAAWILPRDQRMPVPCMARRRSHLGIRVARLLDGRPTSGTARPRRALLTLLALLVLAPWIAPSVAPATERHGEHDRAEHDTRSEHGSRRKSHDERHNK